MVPLNCIITGNIAVKNSNSNEPSISVTFPEPMTFMLFVLTQDERRLYREIVHVRDPKVPSVFRIALSCRHFGKIKLTPRDSKYCSIWTEYMFLGKGNCSQTIHKVPNYVIGPFTSSSQFYITTSSLHQGQYVTKTSNLKSTLPPPPLSSARSVNRSSASGPSSSFSYVPLKVVLPTAVLGVLIFLCVLLIWRRVLRKRKIQRERLEERQVHTSLYGLTQEDKLRRLRDFYTRRRDSRRHSYIQFKRSELQAVGSRTNSYHHHVQNSYDLLLNNVAHTQL